MVGRASERPNKGMKQTKGGWSRGGASSPAIPRSVVTAGGSRRSRPSQLIPGVRPTVASAAHGSRPGRGHGAPSRWCGRSVCGAPELPSSATWLQVVRPCACGSLPVHGVSVPRQRLHVPQPNLLVSTFVRTARAGASCCQPTLFAAGASQPAWLDRRDVARRATPSGVRWASGLA